MPNIPSRIQQKHDVEANWNKAVNFIPKAGEIIIYDKDDNFNYPRIKIGDGITLINDLNFIIEIDATLSIAGAAADAKVVGDSLMNIESYIFNIDYDTLLSFDTSEIVFDTSTSSKTSILGKAILGQMILA